MQDPEIQSVALKSLLDECVALSRPDAARSTDELWFTFSKEFRVLANYERLKAVLLKLLTHGIGSANYREVKVWISRSPVLKNGIRLGFRGAIPWPASNDILQDVNDREWLHLEYESESNVRLLKLESTNKPASERYETAATRSDEPNFSVLWVDLDLCTEKKKELAEQHSNGEQEAMADNDKSNFRILYIEDNSANLSLVETALTHREQVELLKAGTAEEGLLVAESEIPDLILLDINLPGIDGYEALYRLTNNPKTRNIPVIAVSANALGHDVERAKKAGARDYLVKPYSIAKFFELIDEWTGYANESLQA
jgi:CheY-like chemotaxis protein